MKVLQVRISNILGINSLEFQPTANGVTVIEGRNDVGKTSVLSAIQAAVKKGYDATLLRRGEKDGEAVIVLEHDFHQYEITRTVDSAGQDLVVKKDGIPQKKPQTVLDALFPDQIILNPKLFLDGQKSDRVDFLLDLVKITVTDEELSKATDGLAHLGPKSKRDFAEIEFAHEKIYEERRRLRNLWEEKEATVTQIRAGLPETVEISAGAHKVAKEEVEAAKEDLGSRRRVVATALQQEESRIEASIATNIAALRQVFDRKCQEARDAGAVELKAARAQAATASCEVEDQCRETIVQAEAKLQRIETNMTAVVKAQTLADHAAQVEEVGATLKTQWDRHERAIGGLKKLKEDKLSVLPLKGVTVDAGEIVFDGIPFPRLNTARKVSLLFNIIRHRAKMTGNQFVVIDGLELFDNEQFAAMEGFCEKNGLQVCCTRVSGTGDLTVRTKGGEPVQ